MNRKTCLCASVVSLLGLLASCGGGSSSSSSSSIVSSSKEVSSEASSVASSAEEQKFLVKTAPYYVAEKQEGDYVPKKEADFEYGYFEDRSQSIYMDLGFALKYVHKKDITVTAQGDAVTYTCPTGVSYTLDTKLEQIKIHQMDYGNLFSMNYDVPLGLIDSGYAKKYVDTSGGVYHPSDDITLDLAPYSLDIVAHEGRAYLPFAIVSELTFTLTYYSPVAFNGTAFYFIDNTGGGMSLSYRDNSYVKAYYSGANSKAAKQDYFIQDNANLLFFVMDTFFGFAEERFAPMSTYLKTNHPDIYEGLFSKDEATYNNAVTRMMNYAIGDGHTNGRNASSTFGSGKTEVSTESSARSSKLTADRLQCMTLRNGSGVTPNVVRYSGNTAILSFDGFSHCNADLSKDNVATYAKDNGDTFALAYMAMEEIEKRGDIENVIFDITCNGGGDTNGLLPMIGIMDADFQSLSYNPLSKGYSDLKYKVDANLDGVFNEEDGYKGEYNFFILASNYSFSCANMLCFIAKSNDAATLIGETSGGGACAVGYSVTADGKPFRMSSLSRTGELDDPSSHDDLGVAPDYELKRDYFYDDEYLNTFVNSL